MDVLRFGAWKSRTCSLIQRLHIFLLSGTVCMQVWLYFNRDLNPTVGNRRPQISESGSKDAGKRYAKAREYLSRFVKNDRTTRGSDSATGPDSARRGAGRPELAYGDPCCAQRSVYIDTCSRHGESACLDTSAVSWDGIARLKGPVLAWQIQHKSLGGHVGRFRVAY